MQAAVLQNVQVREGLHEVQANIEFEIENAGVKNAWFRLPADAVGVRFRGAAVADAYKAEDGEQGKWEVKLSRRYIGKLQIHLSYPEFGQRGHTEEGSRIYGIILDGINLQRGFSHLEN